MVSLVVVPSGQVSENDLGGTGIYRTHLVKTVLQFDWLGRGNRNFIQSDWGGVGNFELLVPQGKVIREYFRNNDDPELRWHYLREFGYPPAQIGQPPPGEPRSVTFFQSTYKGDGVHGNFEAIVRVQRPPLAPDHLDWWYFDSQTGQWNGPSPLHADGQPISGVTGN